MKGQTHHAPLRPCSLFVNTDRTLGRFFGKKASALMSPQARIGAVLRKQFDVRSLFDDASLVHDDEAVPRLHHDHGQHRNRYIANLLFQGLRYLSASTRASCHKSSRFGKDGARVDAKFLATAGSQNIRINPVGQRLRHLSGCFCVLLQKFQTKFTARYCLLSKPLRDFTR